MCYSDIKLSGKLIKHLTRLKMKNEIKKISEARIETLIVEIGILDANSRLYARDNQNSKTWSKWAITTQEQHDHLIKKVGNDKNRISELGAIYLGMIR